MELSSITNEMIYEKLLEILANLRPPNSVPMQESSQKPIDAFRFRTQGQVRHVLEMQARKKARER